MPVTLVPMEALMKAPPVSGLPASLMVPDIFDRAAGEGFFGGTRASVSPNRILPVPVTPPLKVRLPPTVDIPRVTPP